MMLVQIQIAFPTINLNEAAQTDLPSILIFSSLSSDDSEESSSSSSSSEDDPLVFIPFHENKNPWDGHSIQGLINAPETTMTILSCWILGCLQDHSLSKLMFDYCFLLHQLSLFMQNALPSL